MTNTKIILDTHVLLWTLLSPNELSSKTQDIISSAQRGGSLFISCISLWEIGMLITKRKINVYEPVSSFLKAISEIEGLNIAQVSHSIAADSCLLPNFHGDPADRIITATAREFAGLLLTRDEKIIKWADNGSIKVLSA